MINSFAHVLYQFAMRKQVEKMTRETDKSEIIRQKKKDNAMRQGRG